MSLKEDIMKKLFGKSAVLASSICTLLLVLTSLLPASAWKGDDNDDGPKFGPWSVPMNLGPPVNTILADYQPFISKDGLSLYFSVLEGPTPNFPQDIWVAKRNSESDNWGAPQKLGPEINTPATEGQAFVTVDGHWMYFNSDRNTPDANGVLRSLLKYIQCPSTVTNAWPSVAGVLISGPSFCGAPQLSDSELRFATQMSCGKFGVGPSRTEKYRLSPSLEMNGW